MKPIIFINSHPIQYFAPFYKYATAHNLNCEVWYLSKFGLQNEIDKQFGQKIKWDIPLLDGYKHEFFENSIFKSTVYKPWGIFNLSLIKKLKNQVPSIIVFNGWNYLSYFILWFIAPLFKHKIVFRGETPISHELLRRPLIKKIRKIVLSIYLKRFDYVLYIGNQNMQFHKYLNVPDSKLIFSPYSVDNDHFIQKNENLKMDRSSIRNKFHIPLEAKVFITSGKYIHKKRPLDIIEAFNKLPNTSNIYLIMVGEGPLRPKMEDFIKTNNIKNIILTGFVNQSAISEYYSIADYYIMASGVGETWGLSTNEAMLFELPIIISSLSGCSSDLVKNNGHIFETGNINELVNAMQHLIKLNDEDIYEMKKQSKAIISNYSYSNLLKSFTTMISNENSING